MYELDFKEWNLRSTGNCAKDDHDLPRSCKTICRDATMDPQVASRRRPVTRDDNDGDAKDACGRGLIKEGQAGGTIRSS